ncbi:unnamed protein product, partial [Callosobruchus maculatus]
MNDRLHRISASSQPRNYLSQYMFCAQGTHTAYAWVPVRRWTS